MDPYDSPAQEPRGAAIAVIESAVSQSISCHFSGEAASAAKSLLYGVFIVVTRPAASHLFMFLLSPVSDLLHF